MSVSVFMLVLSSCYLAFRVCRLEQQLSFLSSQPTLRDKYDAHTLTHVCMKYKRYEEVICDRAVKPRLNLTDEMCALNLELGLGVFGLA